MGFEFGHVKKCFGGLPCHFLNGSNALLTRVVGAAHAHDELLQARLWAAHDSQKRNKRLSDAKKKELICIRDNQPLATLAEKWS